jgi:hypothetical protein
MTKQEMNKEPWRGNTLKPFNPSTTRRWKDNINPLGTRSNSSYLKIRFEPRSKHFTSLNAV